MKSSSLKMIDSGIKDPRAYRDALVHDFYVPEEYQKHLKMYLLAETHVGQMFLNIKDGELTVKNRQYSITWLDSPAIVRENSYALVSLRWCDYLHRGYALVKVLRGEGKFQTLEYK